MRALFLASILVIIVAGLWACTNPNVPPDQIVNYNTAVFGFWLQVLGTVVALLTPVIVWLVNRNTQRKLDVQQGELLRVADRQTHEIAENTAAAVEEVGQKAAIAVLDLAQQTAAQDARRDRRASDKPIIGG